jgi:hypothetical protein
MWNWNLAQIYKYVKLLTSTDAVIPWRLLHDPQAKPNDNANHAQGTSYIPQTL